MKQFMAAVLCLALLIALAGCAPAGPSISADLGFSTSQDPEEPEISATPCDIVFEELASGGGLAEQFLDETENSGIMREILATLGYEVTGQEELESGAIRYSLEITAIDMAALLEDLPGNLSSKEEALEEMLQMVEDAERKTFEAELTVVPTAEGGYTYEYGRDFINAVTGGMLDLIEESFDLEVVAE